MPTATTLVQALIHHTGILSRFFNQCVWFNLLVTWSFTKHSYLACSHMSLFISFFHLESTWTHWTPTYIKNNKRKEEQRKEEKEKKKDGKKTPHLWHGTAPDSVLGHSVGCPGTAVHSVRASLSCEVPELKALWFLVSLQCSAHQTGALTKELWKGIKCPEHLFYTTF